MYKVNRISKSNNRTLRSASTGIDAQSLLSRGHFEGENSDYTRSNAILSAAYSHLGKKSMKLTLTASTTASFSRTTQSLTAGTSYAFSAYVRTTDVTSFTGGEDSGICLKVTDAGGQTHTSHMLSYATSEDTDDGWVRLCVVFKPTATGVCTVSCVGSGAVGTAYVDDMQLEEGEGPSAYNMLENGSMEDSSLDSLCPVQTLGFVKQNKHHIPPLIRLDRRGFCSAGDRGKSAESGGGGCFCYI